MEKKIAILVADLAGYTALTEVHGSLSAAQMVERYLHLVNQALYGSSKLVERVGDEVIIVAEEASDLVETACKLLRLAAQEENFLAIHAGLHIGEILEQNGSFYGTTINLASRIASYSQAGQILCSSSFRDALENSRAGFKVVGEVSFKNLRNKVMLFEIASECNSLPPLFDPVCRMLIMPHRSISMLYEGQTYHFCSSQCQQIFSSSPKDFTISK